MSGATLAVAPQTGKDGTTPKSQSKPIQSQSMFGNVMGSLRVIELQLVAFIMVFSVSGLVPVLDLIFAAVTSAYLLALACLVFPSHDHNSSASHEIFQGSKIFRLYVVFGTTIGLFLPLAYVLGGFARGDDHALRSATPHLFLLSFQILTENVLSGLSLFSPPVRAFVPLFYTARRMVVIGDWLADVWINKTLPANATPSDMAWFWFGRNLAIANFFYFSTNLCCFLIPQFLPRAFERYFKDRDNETEAKSVEDKRSSAANKSSQHVDNNKKAD